MGTSLQVSARRKRLKELSLKYKGCKCVLCGYDRCAAALEFHHVNRTEKSFGISHRGITRKWDVLKQELDKCVLLCANCHREVEAGVSFVPANLTGINYPVVDKAPKKKRFCVVCGKEALGICCSVECNAVKRRKVVRPSREELETGIKTTSMLALGKRYGVSDSSVRKWAKAYGLI